MVGFFSERKGASVSLQVLACAALSVSGVYVAGCAGTVRATSASSTPSPTPQQGQAITVTPSSVSFGSVTVGTSNSQTVRLANNSQSNVMITNVAVSGAGINASGITLPMSV